MCERRAARRLVLVLVGISTLLLLLHRPALIWVVAWLSRGLILLLLLVRLRVLLAILRLVSSILRGRVVLVVLVIVALLLVLLTLLVLATLIVRHGEDSLGQD